jgi:hypothetical protein
LTGTNAPDQLPDAEHGGAGADQAAARRGCDGRCERLDQFALLDSALDGGEQQREVERLGEVVEGAVAHRLDGALAVAVGGSDDDGNVAVRAGPELAQQCEAVAVP